MLTSMQCNMQPNTWLHEAMTGRAGGDEIERPLSEASICQCKWTKSGGFFFSCPLSFAVFGPALWGKFWVMQAGKAFRRFFDLTRRQLVGPEIDHL